MIPPSTAAVPRRTAASLLLLLAAACAAGPGASAGPAYDAALAACRAQHSGQASRTIGLAPDDSHIADCLRRKGWQPDGRPVPNPAAP